MPLVLTRGVGESFVIGDNVIVAVLETRGNQVRLGIEAPREIPVHRLEVYLRIQAEKKKKEKSYKEMIEELAEDGVYNLESISDEDIDRLAWAKFQGRCDGNDEAWIDSALACVDGWGSKLKSGNMAEFNRLLREGMSHHLADSIQDDLDEANERLGFNRHIDNVSGLSKAAARGRGNV